MTKEQTFLITYGLHNFVTCALKNGHRVFFIKCRETQKNMVRHAKYLITESFGDGTDIQVV